MHDTSRHLSRGWPPFDPANDLQREARQRFVVAFPKHCESIDLLLKTIAVRGPKGSSESLRQMAHQIASTAGTLGFPNVSDRASELEMLAAQADKGFSLEVARGQLEALREAFARELSSAPASVGAAVVTSKSPIPVIIADRSAEQRQLVSDYLQLAGYEPIPLSTGEQVLEAARVHNPGAIVLEPDLAGLDGYSVCRRLKADPLVASIPVVFITTRSTLEDKLEGLALGADDYLVKPIDPRELLERIDLILFGAGGRG
jgi:CheY-like chemotaxis protein